MKFTPLAFVACSLLLTDASKAAAASVTGPAALALAGVVAQYAPLPAANKKAVAAFFKGDPNFPYKGKVSVAAEKIICRTSNVDITARSCEVTFKIKKQTLSGREAEIRPCLGFVQDCRRSIQPCLNRKPAQAPSAAMRR